MISASSSSKKRMEEAQVRALGGSRCPHCKAPLSKAHEASSWTIDPFLRDSFAIIGTAVGTSVSAFYSMNHVLPPVTRWVKGPMWLQLLVGVPPILLLSATCAGLAGGAMPAIAQLAVSSYHVASMSRTREATMGIEQGEGFSRSGLSAQSSRDKG